MKNCMLGSMNFPRKLKRLAKLIRLELSHFKKGKNGGKADLGQIRLLLPRLGTAKVENGASTPL